jgi:hypothetical protein
MDVASAGNSAAGGKGTSANALLVMQREMKSKLEAPPKAAIIESRKGAGDQKAKQSTSGIDNSDPYSVGGAMEGLREASTAQEDGTIAVCGPSHTNAACQVLPYLQKRQGSLHYLQ